MLLSISLLLLAACTMGANRTSDPPVVVLKVRRLSAYSAANVIGRPQAGSAVSGAFVTLFEQGD
jgi:hypothetical protein